MPERTDDNREQTALEGDLDKLSLNQALLDFEIANARVIDLTHRLIDSTNTVAALRAELDQLRLEHAELRGLHERMQSSRAYRLADKIWNLRQAIGV